MIPTFKFEYVSYEELYYAYLDCRKRKRHSPGGAAFEVNITKNLYKLWIELNRNEYEIGKSIVFVVDKPVKREVFAADFRDRIVHHLIINRINKYLEEEFIANSFSCRVGKGTLNAIQTLYKQAEKLSNNFTKDIYVLKCDLKSFFMSIDKNILYLKLENLVKTKVHPNDQRQSDFLCQLIYKVIMNEPQKGCLFRCNKKRWYGLPKEKSLFYNNCGFGLPIGNLTSQMFASYFLNDFDHFVISILGFPNYGRYVDDFYILSEDKEKLIQAIPLMKQKLKEIGIILHPKKVYLQNIKKGVKFVGGIVMPNRTYISNRTKGNLYKSLYDSYIYVQNNNLTKSDIFAFVNSFNSYFGFLKYHKTFGIRKKIFLSKAIEPWYKFCYIDKSLLKLKIYRDYNIFNKGYSKYSLQQYPKKYKVKVFNPPLLVR